MDLLAYVKALTFAAEAHKFQRRKDAFGLPFINHPIRVSVSVINALNSVNRTNMAAVTAALLHDTVEDTTVSIVDIENTFGANVASIVAEVTDDKTLDKVSRKKLQILHAENASYEAKLVKLADKLDNLTDLAQTLPNGWTEETRLGYFVWSYHVVAAMRCTNDYLESELDKLFLANIPADINLRQALDDYYERLASRLEFTSFTWNLHKKVNSRLESELTETSNESASDDDYYKHL